MQIIASAIAGSLIALIGTDAAFAVNAATFVISALLIVRLVIPQHAGHLGQETTRGLDRYLGEAQEGLRYARHDPLVSRLLIVQSLASFAVGATGAMLVVLSEQHLDLRPSGFAWLIGAIDAGALLGPLIPNALAQDYRTARWMFVPYIVRGVGDVLLALFTPLPVALLILFVYGLKYLGRDGGLQRRRAGCGAGSGAGKGLHAARCVLERDAAALAGIGSGRGGCGRRSTLILVRGRVARRRRHTRYGASGEP